MPGNIFQEMDCCKGEAFNINVKNVAGQDWRSLLSYQGYSVATSDSKV